MSHDHISQSRGSGSLNNYFNASRMVKLALLLFGAGLLITAPRLALAFDPPVEVYYVSEPEDHLFTAFDTINGGTESPIFTTISITIGQDGTLLYYDQWEDGFAADIANPSGGEIYANPGNLDGVQIWGDGNPANGAPPGYPGDVLNSGNVIVLQNDVPVPNVASTIQWDGKDKIGATSAIAVTRAAWPQNIDALFAYANAMFPTSEWGTAYTVPVGCDTVSSSMFEYSAISIIASRNDTVIQIDADADPATGTDGYEIQVTLDEGESFLEGSRSKSGCDYIQQGARVRTTDASKPFQVHLLTGDIDGTPGYEARDLNLVPNAQLSGDYWIPVGRQGSTGGATPSGPVRLFFYNPGPGVLHVKCDRGNPISAAWANNIAVGAVGTIDLVDNQGAHCYAVTASGGNTQDLTRVFTGMATVDTAGVSSASGQIFDWGFPLIPTSALSNRALVGWAPGRDPGGGASTENGSPIWVTPICNTYFYVDWNGDGTPDDVDLNNNGVIDAGAEANSSNGFQILQGVSTRLFDIDDDQTGAYIFTKTTTGNPVNDPGGCKFAAAWGEDPDSASAAQPGLDAGTIIRSLKGVETSKASVLWIDTNGDGKPGPGDTLRFTISIENVGFAPVDVSVYDTIPTYTTYVANSTYKNTPPTATPVADVQILDAGGGDGFPLDESLAGVALGSLPLDRTWTVRFDVLLDPINPPGFPDYAEVNNCASIGYDTNTVTACDVEEIVQPLVVHLTKTANPVNVVPDNNVTYTIRYWNVDQGPNTDVATNLTVTDVLDPNLQFVSATPTTPNPGGGANPGICNHDGSPNGGTLTCTGLSNPGPGTPPDTPYGQIILVAKVIKNATTIVTGFQLPNTAEVCGYGATRPTIQVCDDDTVTITTPVTLAYFKAEPTSGGTSFEWSTASETANAGFNLYVETDNGLERVNDELIPSTVIDSQIPQDYRYEAPGTGGEMFYIEDVGLFGENRFHGPFAAGEGFGKRGEAVAIDWAAITAENEALARQRAAAQSAELTSDSETGVAAVAANPRAVELRVNKDGLHRVTYEDLEAAGVLLGRVPRRQLALTTSGQVVPIFVSRPIFGPGAYIEFIGEGLDTMYTDTNVYRLEVNPGMGQLATIHRPRPKRIAVNQAPSYYMETTTVAENKVYGYFSPTSDPWFDSFMHSGISKIWTYNLDVDNYVSSAAPVTLNVSLWGATDIMPGPEHHTLVAINGVEVADKVYDGVEIVNLSTEIPPGVLQEGENELVFTQPMDLGALTDVSALESYGLVYPRAFVARDGRLTFQGQAQAFKVTNLPGKQVVVYRQESDGRLVKLTGLTFSAGANGTWQVAFKGTSTNATYYVSTVTALETPQVTAARAPIDYSGEAELLVIAHPNFISGLSPWLAARQAQGYTVRVVDVYDIYATHSYGIVDANAIAEFIRGAIIYQGVEYVALIGGDTYDYRNYLNLGSISFIPSLYANTINRINFAPVDPLYTDIDGDMVPDAAIGRFPVRTTTELQMMIDKTLQYDARTNVTTAIFAADAGFEADSNSFASALNGWTIDKAYVTDAGESPAARAALIAALNQGPRLTSFVGHSGVNHWTSYPLFTASHAAALTNTNMPTVVTQWGCWNTYFVEPTAVTLSQNFLLSGMNGAAAVTGATTLTNSSSERALGVLMMPKLMTSGTTLGAAMQEAKSELALTHPEMRDVLLGWTVLGDPTVVVRP